jgi:hypothetical protein
MSLLGGLVSQRPATGRLIGVFDFASGLPLEDVQVLDLRTGTSARTTKTDTVALTFVDSAGSLMTIRKIGYTPLTQFISNSNADRPLTVTLAPVTQVLPEVLTAGRAGLAHRGSADTLRTLELNGFYDRRISTAAPMSAFVTGEKLNRLTSLNNIYSLTGRGLCTQNLYVDGLRLSSGIRVARFLRPEMVAGIELYTHPPEIPAVYSATLPSGSTAGCATVIWTKWGR